jgi:hypothetical protein
VLAEFMVMWRWEHTPQTDSFRWTLEMPQVALLLSNSYAGADLWEFHAKVGTRERKDMKEQAICSRWPHR